MAEDWAEKKRALAASDPRSSAELVTAALKSNSEDDVWELVPILHARGGQQEFDLGKALARSESKRQRRLGADILGQLGWDDRPFHDEAVNLLIGLLKDPDIYVLQSAVIALAHRKDRRALPHFISLKDHPDPLVRMGVTQGLMEFDDPSATAALKHMTSDQHPHVASWATFGIGDGAIVPVKPEDTGEEKE